MAVGKGDRGPLWVDGRFTARVRGPGPGPGRVVRLRRPFALIGRLPGVDLHVDDPAVGARHAFLLLDRRGVFGVDLLTRTGTRFAGAVATSAWLAAGDVLEVAGRRVELLQLQVDGSTIDPPLCSDDPLADADPADLVALTLEPIDATGPPWMLGSALAFAGRGEACAIRIEGASASKTHCALLRGPTSAYVIDLLGRGTALNDRPVEGASALLDGDVLTIGRARFGVRVEPPASPRADPPTVGTGLAPYLAPGLPDGLPEGSHGAVLAVLLAGASRNHDASRDEILEALRRFQFDAATLLEAQVDRIEALSREVAALRAEIRGHRPPPTEPLRLDLPPRAPSESIESAAWLLDRINHLEPEGRSAWKELVGRIASTVLPRPNPHHDDQS